ncbi:hypothetical protein D3C74_460120 [compost metagenome]
MRYVGNKHVDDCYEVVKRMIEQRELIPGEPAPSALEEANRDNMKIEARSISSNGADEPAKESKDQ